HGDGSAAWHQQTVQMQEQGGLSGSISADHADMLTALEAEGHPVQGTRTIGIGVADGVDVQDGTGLHGPAILHAMASPSTTATKQASMAVTGPVWRVIAVPSKPRASIARWTRSARA